MEHAGPDSRAARNAFHAIEGIDADLAHVLAAGVMPGRRVFKTRHFGRWAAKVGLTDGALGDAVQEMLHGLIDADLGGGLLKKRIALAGRGKSGGARMIVATNRVDRWFLLIGFAKNERDNLEEVERRALLQLARELLSLSDRELASRVWRRALEEIDHGREN